MFFVKTAFWLTLVIAFIPVDQNQLGDKQPNISAMQTVGLAQSVIDDFSNFCKRNAQACETGGLIISQMGLKAREGARIVYTYLDENYDKDTATAENPTTDKVQTGSVSVK